VKGSTPVGIERVGDPDLIDAERQLTPPSR
jgi:hypothetical protein